jgi:hypothetical protein
MEQLLKEILKGVKEYNPHCYPAIKGIGSKAYIYKRIDLLREELLELKKSIK